MHPSNALIKQSEWVPSDSIANSLLFDLCCEFAHVAYMENYYHI